MTDNALITWSVLMPVKVLSEAKSRLAGLAGLMCHLASPGPLSAQAGYYGHVSRQGRHQQLSIGYCAAVSPA